MKALDDFKLYLGEILPLIGAFLMLIALITRFIVNIIPDPYIKPIMELNSFNATDTRDESLHHHHESLHHHHQSLDTSCNKFSWKKTLLSNQHDQGMDQGFKIYDYIIFFCSLITSLLGIIYLIATYMVHQDSFLVHKFAEGGWIENMLNRGGLEIQRKQFLVEAREFQGKRISQRLSVASGGQTEAPASVPRYKTMIDGQNQPSAGNLECTSDSCCDVREDDKNDKNIKKDKQISHSDIFSWFHDDTDRLKAEEILKDPFYKPGSFLIRASANIKIEEPVISVKMKKKNQNGVTRHEIYHYLIYCQKGRKNYHDTFYIDTGDSTQKKFFPSLANLFSHYMNSDRGGLLLKYPVEYPIKKGRCCQRRSNRLSVADKVGNTSDLSRYSPLPDAETSDSENDVPKINGPYEAIHPVIHK